MPLDKVKAKARSDRYRAKLDPQVRRARAKAWRDANLEKAREKAKWGKLKHLYGITKDKYVGMPTAQDGKCDICEKPPESLGVDHCHTTGTIRGLLCFGCNVAVGHLGDTSASVMRAVEYLRVHE